MAIEKTSATENYWTEFVAASGTEGNDYTVVVFGDGSKFWDQLVELVLQGTKRATASLARDYAPGGEPMPQKGDFVVVIDSKGTPRCIWRTTEIVVKPLLAVDDAFAWDEGEGDRTRETWLANHRSYFSRQAAQEGFEMSDDIETVFERFEIVWPPQYSDVSR